MDGCVLDFHREARLVGLSGLQLHPPVLKSRAPQPAASAPAGPDEASREHLYLQDYSKAMVAVDTLLDSV